MEFKKVPGSLGVIAAGSMTSIWGINPKFQVYKWSGQKWDLEVGCALSRISVGHDGTVWGIDAQYASIFSILYPVAVGDKNNIWGLTQTMDIYKWNVQQKSWVNIPGKLSQISVNRHGKACGLYGTSIYEFAGSTWRQIPGTLQYIDVGDDGVIRGIYNGQVFEMKQQWMNVTNKYPAGVVAFAVVTEKFSVALTQNCEVHFKGFVEKKKKGKGFVQIPGKLKTVCVGNKDIVWGLNKTNLIYRKKGNGWEQVAGKLLDISVGVDGSVWGIGDGNKVYHRVGNNWIDVSTAEGAYLKSIAVGSAAHIYGVDIQGGVWQRSQVNQNMGQWKKIPGALKKICVNSHAHVYGLSDVGGVFQFFGGKWRGFPGKLDDIKVDETGQVWGVLKNQVFSWKQKHNQWRNITKRFPKKTVAISVFSQNLMWAIDEKDDIFCKVSLKKTNVEVYFPTPTSKTAKPDVSTSVKQPQVQPQQVQPQVQPQVQVQPQQVQPQVNVQLGGGLLGNMMGQVTQMAQQQQQQAVSAQQQMQHQFGNVQQPPKQPQVQQKPTPQPQKQPDVNVEINFNPFAMMGGQPKKEPKPQKKPTIQQPPQQKQQPPQQQPQGELPMEISFHPFGNIGGNKPQQPVQQQPPQQKLPPQQQPPQQQPQGDMPMEISFHPFGNLGGNQPKKAPTPTQPQQQQPQQQQQQPPMEINFNPFAKLGAQLQQKQPQQQPLQQQQPQISLNPFGGGGGSMASAMDPQSFAGFVTSLQKESFSAGKKRVIDSVAPYNYFTCSQLSEVIKNLSFGADKQHAISKIAPKVIDKQNKHTIYSVLTFSSEKQFLDKFM